jgi:hypothetical protein
LSEGIKLVRLGGGWWVVFHIHSVPDCGCA